MMSNFEPSDRLLSGLSEMQAPGDLSAANCTRRTVGNGG